MRKRNLLGLFLLGLTVLFFYGCADLFGSDDKSDDEPEPVVLTPSFDLTDAVAIAKSVADEPSEASVNTSSGGTPELFRIDSSGSIHSASENVSIVDFAIYGDSIFVSAQLLYEDGTSGDSAYFLVISDGSYQELEVPGMPVGENEIGNLVFQDASVYNPATGTLTELTTTLDEPGVQSMSGNFAVIGDDSIFQAFDTATSYRYNIAGCNGPSLVALDQSTALVDDCGGDTLIDMTTGSRSSAEITGWNHESIYIGNGAVILSQSMPGSGSGFHLGFVATDGTVTSMISDDMDPGSSWCMNCGTPNTVLFGDGDWFVVRELDQITVVDWPALSDQKTILSGYNVTSIDVVDTIVYFVAEDSLGNAVAGTHNLETDQTELFDTTTALETIRAIQSS